MQPFAELGALDEGRWRDKKLRREYIRGHRHNGTKETDLSARIDPGRSFDRSADHAFRRAKAKLK